MSLWSTALLTPLLFYNEVKVKDFMLFTTNAGDEDSQKKYVDFLKSILILPIGISAVDPEHRTLYIVQ